MTIWRRSPGAFRRGAGVCSGAWTLFINSDDRDSNQDNEVPTQVVVYHGTASWDYRPASISTEHYTCRI
jgi:hypothetical protein